MAQNFENNPYEQAMETKFPVAVVESKLASSSNMSLVVAATVTRDQLDAIQPTFEGRSKERWMHDQDRPILHTELRLDGCLKPDGKMGPLKSLHIHVDDDDGVLPLRPGSPLRTISVTMSDQMRVSKIKDHIFSESWETDTRDNMDVRMRKQLMWRNPNIVVEAPFNVHNYHAQMSGDQPQGLAIALTKEVVPEILSSLKEPQGLRAVLFFDDSTPDKCNDNEIIKKKADMRTNFDEYEEKLISDQENAYMSMKSGISKALHPFPHEFVDYKNKNYDSECFGDEEEQKQTNFIDTVSPSTYESRRLENLQILQSLPQDLMSSLVKSHSKNIAASEHSEESEREGKSSPHKHSYKNVVHLSYEGSPRRSRDDNFGKVFDSSNTSCATNSSSRVYGSSQRKSREGQRSSKKVHNIIGQGGHDHKERSSSRRSKHHNEQTKDGHKDQISTRHSKYHMGQVDKTPSSSFTNEWMTSTTYGDSSYHEDTSGKKRSKKFLQDVQEDNKMQYDNPPPPPPLAPPLVETFERHKDSQRIKSLTDSRHKTQKSSHPQDFDGSMSFQSSSVYGDDHQSYNSTNRTKSYLDSYQEPHRNDQTHGSNDLANNKVNEADAKMLTISRLLDNMSSITQLLSNFPQPILEGDQLQNLSNSPYLQGASNSNGPSQQFLSNDGIWQLDKVNNHALQTNQMAFANSHNAHYLDGGPPQPSSISANVPTQLDNMQSIMSSQVHNTSDFLVLDDVNNKTSQHFNNQFPQRSSQSSQLVLEDRASQMNIQDLDLQQYDALDHRLIHPKMQNDDSILLGIMNRPSQLNVGQQSQLLKNRVSRQNILNDNAHDSVKMTEKMVQSINNKPLQISSQDKDLQLFDTMSNRASPLAIAQQQDKKLSQRHRSNQFDKDEKRSSHLQDNFQQAISMDNSSPQRLNDEQYQIEQHQFGDLDNQFMQMDMQVDDSHMPSNMSVRTSQLHKNIQSYLNTQRQESKPFETFDNRRSQLLNNKQSQIGIRDNNSQQLNAQDMNIRSLQLDKHIDDSRIFGSMNNKVSQLDMQDLHQFDPMNAQPSQLLNPRPSQMYLQVDKLQQVDIMDNRSSKLLNTKLSQTHMQNDVSQQFGSMSPQSSQLLNVRLSQTNLPDDGLQQYDALNVEIQPSEILNTRSSQMNLPLNVEIQPSEILNTRSSQMNLPRDGLQEYDVMNPRVSQLRSTRSSQVNLRPSQLLNTRQSQRNMQSDMHFDLVNPRVSHPMHSRPSQVGIQEDNFQQSDSMKQQQLSQSLTTRLSHIAKQDVDSQQFDTMNAQRPSNSQAFTTRPSQTNMFYDDIQQFDPINQRPSLVGYNIPSQIQIRQSQLINTRPSQTILQDDNYRQVDQINSQPVELLNTISSQFDMQNNNLQQFNSINPWQSQSSNTKPSQIGIQDDDLQQFDSMNHIGSLQNIMSSHLDMPPSTFLNVRPSQMSPQDDSLQQQYDALDIKPSHLNIMQEDYEQKFDPMNHRSSELSPVYLQDVDSMNLHGDNLQYSDPKNPENGHIQYSNSQDDNISYSDPTNIQSSQFIESQLSQRVSFRPSQSNSQQTISEMCDNCFELGHDALSCPIQGCSNCCEFGHYAQACVKPKAEQVTADNAIPTTILQQEDLTHQYDDDALANVRYENTSHMGDSQEEQVLESLGTVDDDNQNLQTRELGISDNETYSDYTSTT